MRAYHFKILIGHTDTFKNIHALMPQLEYEPGMERGFVLSKESSVNVIRGRYFYTKFNKQVSIDPDTLDKKEETLESLAECRFELNQTRGMVMVEDRRGELNQIFDALESMPDVHTDFEELNLNLTDLLFELQSVWKKNEIRSIKIKEYLAREPMIANASFKVLEPQMAEKIVEKFSDQIAAFTMALKLPDGVINLTVTKNGSVRMSDDAPDEILTTIKDSLMRFHEAEVETTSIKNPVAARRR